MPIIKLLICLCKDMVAYMVYVANFSARLHSILNIPEDGPRLFNTPTGHTTLLRR